MTKTSWWNDPLWFLRKSSKKKPIGGGRRHPNSFGNKGNHQCRFINDDPHRLDSVTGQWILLMPNPTKPRVTLREKMSMDGGAHGGHQWLVSRTRPDHHGRGRGQKRVWGDSSKRKQPRTGDRQHRVSWGKKNKASAWWQRTGSGSDSGSHSEGPPRTKWWRRSDRKRPRETGDDSQKSGKKWWGGGFSTDGGGRRNNKGGAWWGKGGSDSDSDSHSEGPPRTKWWRRSGRKRSRETGDNNQKPGKKWWGGDDSDSDSDSSRRGTARYGHRKRVKRQGGFPDSNSSNSDPLGGLGANKPAVLVGDSGSSDNSSSDNSSLGLPPLAGKNEQQGGMWGGDNSSSDNNSLGLPPLAGKNEQQGGMWGGDNSSSDNSSLGLPPPAGKNEQQGGMWGGDNSSSDNSSLGLPPPVGKNEQQGGMWGGDNSSSDNSSLGLPPLADKNEQQSGMRGIGDGSSSGASGSTDGSSLPAIDPGATWSDSGKLPSPQQGQPQSMFFADGDDEREVQTPCGKMKFGKFIEAYHAMTREQREIFKRKVDTMMNTVSGV